MTMPTDQDVKTSVEEVIKQLRALVIIDEVGSDNPLGRQAADLLSKLSGEVERAREAMRPFASWADDNTADDPFSPGYGIWAGNRCERERIVDWFGPTDFRRLRAIAELEGE